MSAACLKFKTPVTGGNVSFYNQSAQDGVDVPVFPTPTIGMMGIIPSKESVTTLAFQNEGDLIYLLGEAKNDINSSEYLYAFHKEKNSPAPFFDLDTEYNLQNTLKGMIKSGIVESAHDCADGGLFITLMESSMPNNLGFEINTDSDFRKDAYLFGEAQSRVVISIKPSNQEAFEKAANKDGFALLGKVKGTDMNVDGESYGSVSAAKAEFDSALENYLTSNN